MFGVFQRQHEHGDGLHAWVYERHRVSDRWRGIPRRCTLSVQAAHVLRGAGPRGYGKLRCEARGRCGRARVASYLRPVPMGGTVARRRDSEDAGISSGLGSSSDLGGSVLEARIRSGRRLSSLVGA